MATSYVGDAIEKLTKANAELEPELLRAEDARALLAEYAEARRLADFGIATLTRKVNDPATVAQVTKTPLGRAKEMVATGKVMGDSAPLDAAMRYGELSIEQATEIAKAEEVSPGAAEGLLETAREQSFQVLRDSARRVKLDAEQHRDLGRRQREARAARSYPDDLGMVNIHLRLQPHIGTPIVNRAEAEAKRVARAARKNGTQEPYERYLADAYATLLSGKGKGSTTRPELVVLVSHEVATRGWTDVRKGEHCKIPGVGPVPPEVAREIAEDAFLNGVFYDGNDLRQIKRWSKYRPRDVQVALELGPPPEFDGPRCIDCGNHYWIEFDHQVPRVAHGPTSPSNLPGRCRPCHRIKTEEDRRNGRDKPPEP
jgi:hypothetical protein